MKKVATIQVYPGDPPAHPDDHVTADPVLEVNFYEQDGVKLRSVTKPHRGKQQGDK